jgi:hypothetical protein
MIGVSGALVIAILLLVLLLLLGAKGFSAARGLSLRSDVPPQEDAAECGPCPPEFVPQIFSRSDWEFVSETKSSKLERIFRRERKAVALLWIQQTSAAIQRIMREHAQATRGNDDLEFATEVKLVLQFAQLMFICGVLFVAIQSMGPLWLRGLALYADSLSQRIAQAQLDLRAATPGGEIRSVEPL